MKKNILFFILGAIIFSSITAYATIRYQASEIEYNNTPLDEVLDDLYIEVNKDILTKLNLSSSKVYTSQSYGTRTSRTVTLSLEKGSYLVFITANNNGLPSSPTTSTYGGINNPSVSVTNGSCSLLKGLRTISGATSTTGNIYIDNFHISIIYVCTISQSSTLTSTHSPSTNTQVTSSIIMQAVKLD